MAEEVKYNNTLVSGRADETLTYTKYVKDESSGKSTKELLDGKVNKTDQLDTTQIADQAVTTEKLADGAVTAEKLAPAIHQGIKDSVIASNEATEQAKAATVKADQATVNAKQATAAATAAKEAADNATQLATNATTASNVATEQAKAATTKADEATAKANEAAQKADESREQTEQTLGTMQEVVDKVSIKDEEGTLVETPFRYIQSEEFIFAKVDAEYKLLFGIQWDGTPVFGKTSAIEDRLQSQVTLLAERVATIMGDEDTTNVIDTINELKKFFAEIENTETLTSILANLNSLNTKFGEDIKNLQDTKVDKEEGKSLIEDEVKECFRVIENEEFLKAIVDSDDKVLFGFYRASGEPYFPFNEMYHVEQNEEFFAIWKDAEDHILMGIRRDGRIVGEIHAVNALKQVVSQLQSDLASLQEKIGTIDTNLKELLDIFSLQDNDEYLAVEQDAEGKILSATNPDGSHYIYNAKSETIPEEFEHIEDPEGRTEITLDADRKVMSYRDANGKKHEHDMEITNLDVSNLNLHGNSVNNIQDALKANGFDVKTPVDWSESSFIQIPEPRFAIINVTNIDSMPTTKQDNKEAFLEFWDMQGNYFKKHAILNAQGNSTMGWSKKNVSMDICDDEWIGDETPKIRIGDWVPQDSFHLKAYHTDFFKGVGAVAYKLYNQIVKTRGNMYDRPWKKALIDMSAIGTTTKSFGNPYVGEYELLTDTGARCFPDGFPVAVYLNGVFYGVFSFQLKKHRDNYHMNKSNAKHVHLDGDIYEATLFNGRNKINWEMFEIRNPKGLYAIGGNKYDADVKQEEIAGEAEVNAWIEAGKLPDGKAIDSKIKKSLQMTAEVKKYIQDFADAMPTIKKARAIYEASSKSEEDLSTLKSIYEKYFDKENMIDYMILSDLIYNYDGFGKNWQWFTYDGVKWWVGLYDTDMSFGGDIYYIRKVPTTHVNTSIGRPNGYVVEYYSSEMENRYSELAKLGIISYEHIFSMLKDWTMRIGTTFYKEEYKKWYFCPCISNSTVRSQYWELVKDSSGNLQTDTSETFDATHSYNIGDEVSFGLNEIAGFYKFRCLKATSAISTNVPHSISDYSPISKFGHVDSIYRAEKWIKENVKNMDSVYHYNRNV
jgi:hypothetical protein